MSCDVGIAIYRTTSKVADRFLNGECRMLTEGLMRTIDNASFSHSEPWNSALSDFASREAARDAEDVICFLRDVLGCRVFDMNCGWPMYRTQYLSTFRYCCGLYQQSHGQRCNHNHVDGPLAARFLLSCIQHRILRPDFMTASEKRLRELLQVKRPDQNKQDRLQLERALATAEREIATVSRNMALSDTPEQRCAMAQIFEEKMARRRSLQGEIENAGNAIKQSGTPDERIDSAMQMARRLNELGNDPTNFKAIGELLESVNARIFLSFGESQKGKRRLRKLLGGIVTFGTTPPPIKIYQGVTSRNLINESAAQPAAEAGEVSAPLVNSDTFAGQEGGSLGNVNRGDRI